MHQASEIGELLNYIDVKSKENLGNQNMVSQSSLYNITK